MGQLKINLHHLLEQAATSNSFAPALTYQNTTRNYAELWHDVVGFAAGLHDAGLERGDRVAIWLEKRIETIVGVFGTSAAGGVFVPINPVLRPRQVAYILADSAARILITSFERLEALKSELGDCSGLEKIVLVDRSFDAGAQTQAGRYVLRSWDTLFDHSDPSVPGSGSIDLDIAAIFYTSGSTGKPKGVVLSHRNLIVGAESVSHYLKNNANDVILSALPLSFDAGFSQITTAMNVGAHVVLMNYLLAGDIVKLCSKHAVTGLTCVPPLWIQIAEQSWPATVGAQLRYFANTGGKMPRSTLDKLRHIFPRAAPYLMYGLTEAFRSTYLDPAEVDRRPDSIGKAIPNAEIVILRPDGTRCAPGEEGELVHRGALVGLGYWNDPARTAERFRPMPGHDQPWRKPEIAVFSGDFVVSDAEGFLFFVGRKDDMIKTSGYRVSPTEIEEVAYDTGLVGDAVAIGVDDAKLGQRIVLVVSPVSGKVLDPEGLLVAMKRLLPLYMLPSAVLVRDTLPRSPNGKFDRTLIREELSS